MRENVACAYERKGIGRRWIICLHLSHVLNSVSSRVVFLRVPVSNQPVTVTFYFRQYNEIARAEGTVSSSDVLAKQQHSQDTVHEVYPPTAVYSIRHPTLSVWFFLWDLFKSITLRVFLNL